MRWFLPFLLLGCPPKVPDHLAVPPPVDPHAKDWTTRAELIAWLVGDDPLARAPKLPDLEAARAVDPAIAAWAEEISSLEQGSGAAALRLQQLEDRHPNTPIPALARGYRLRMAENRLGKLVESDGDTVATLLSPLRKHPAAEHLAKDPLHFLGDEVRTYGDRWVLGAWLQHPDIPVQAVALSLAKPQWDRLANHPLGSIIRSRDGTADPSTAYADLERATLLSLTRAAADRDHEQAAWADALIQARNELHDDDPIDVLLDRAFLALVPAGSDDDAAGSAQVAFYARRWIGDCDTCPGLDRTQGFANAENWGQHAGQMGRVWQVIALKDAVDSMEVGHDTILFPKAIVMLTDALIGTDIGPLDTGLLRRARGDGAAWLTLTRAVGAEPSTEWEGARHAIGRHLEGVATRALADHPDDAFTPLLQRISKRADK